MDDKLTDMVPKIIAALRECPVTECPFCDFTGAGEYDCKLQSLVADILEQLSSVPPNDPLTLEEIRGMGDTDWVWVVFPELDPAKSCWYRASKLSILYSHEHYGKTWLAYRRKPEGGGE